ncbi:MAG TPA: S8 family serine peptidase [Anaerolineae bacterium]|nr:S8 family serine peptidase [Anaerolineae bacterium]
MGGSKWAGMAFTGAVVVLLALLFSSPAVASPLHTSPESNFETFLTFIPLVAKNHTPTETLHPNDPYYPNQWAIQKANMLAAWNHSHGDQILIATLDTGVDFEHADLVSKLRGDIDWDFVNDDDNAQDDYGHGTHVAGIAAATTNNGQGVVGVGWGADILPLKVLNNKGNGSITNIIMALYYATDHGARIINMSLSTGPEYNLQCSQVPALEEALEYAYQHGVLTVVSAGNHSTDASKVIPANCPYVITVAATDAQDAIAAFSNYGSVIDIAAPGKSIYSTDLGNHYSVKSGTSMAAPFVSGVASLVWAAQPTYTVTQVAAALIHQTIDLGNQGWDPIFGYGRVDAAQAVWLGTLPGQSGGEEALLPRPTLTQMSLSQPDPHSYVPQHLLVRFTTEQVATTFMARHQIAEARPLGNGLHLLSVAEGAEWETAQQLLASGAVTYAQPDFVVSVH